MFYTIVTCGFSWSHADSCILAWYTCDLRRNYVLFIRVGVHDGYVLELHRDPSKCLLHFILSCYMHTGILNWLIISGRHESWACVVMHGCAHMTSSYNTCILSPEKKGKETEMEIMRQYRAIGVRESHIHVEIQRLDVSAMDRMHTQCTHMGKCPSWCMLGIAGIIHQKYQFRTTNLVCSCLSFHTSACCQGTNLRSPCKLYNFKYHSAWTFICCVHFCIIKFQCHKAIPYPSYTCPPCYTPGPQSSLLLPKTWRKIALRNFRGVLCLSVWVWILNLVQATLRMYSQQDRSPWASFSDQNSPWLTHSQRSNSPAFDNNFRLPGPPSNFRSASPPGSTHLRPTATGVATECYW